MGRTTKQCFECKEQFRIEELVDYAGPRAKVMHSYCPNCLKEKQSRDKFSDKVCTIFGLKSPGPRIWTERKRIIQNYGYTDDIIIDCLDYIYNVEKKKKLAESLCLVKPPIVDKMMRYKRSKENESIQLAKAMEVETTEYVVPIKENNKVNKIINDPDAWLEDE
jgi:hypothetical protein